MFRTILVLESPWDSSSVRSTSVWPFVSEFAKVRDLDAFYQSFSNVDSFRHWVSCFDKEKLNGKKILYVAAHGTQGRISTLKRSMNNGTIVEVMKKAKSISHVHFGSCLYGKQDNLTKLMASAKHLTSAGGYDTQVDWVDSTLFDIMLWGKVVGRDESNKSMKTHTVVRALLKDIPGLAHALGFNFQYRYGKQIIKLNHAAA